MIRLLEALRRQLRDRRADLAVAGAAHSRAAGRIARAADDISRGRRKSDEEREAALDALARRKRAAGVIQ